MLLRRYHEVLTKVQNKAKEVKEPVKVEFPKIEDITKKEIMEKLDDKGIEYNPMNLKSELYNLLRG